MSQILIVLIVQAIVVHCERQFNLSPGYDACNNSTWDVAGSLPPEERVNCNGLSELLETASSNIVPGDRVIINVEGDNEYYLYAPFYFVVPNVSISIKGVHSSQSTNTGSNRPRIVCELTETLTTTNALYALRFSHSDSIVLDQLEFVGCSRPLSFVDMLNLKITNSSFRFVLLHLIVILQ